MPKKKNLNKHRITTNTTNSSTLLVPIREAIQRLSECIVKADELQAELDYRNNQLSIFIQKQHFAINSIEYKRASDVEKAKIWTDYVDTITKKKQLIESEENNDKVGFRKHDDWVNSVKIVLSKVYRDCKYSELFYGIYTAGLETTNLDNYNSHKLNNLTILLPDEKYWLYGRLKFIKTFSFNESIMRFELTHIDTIKKYIKLWPGSEPPYEPDFNYESFFIRLKALSESNGFAESAPYALEAIEKTSGGSRIRLALYDESALGKDEREEILGIEGDEFAEFLGKFANHFGFGVSELSDADINPIPTLRDSNHNLKQYLENKIEWINRLPLRVKNHLELRLLRQKRVRKNKASNVKRRTTIELDVCIRDIYRRIQRDNPDTKKTTLWQLTAEKFRSEKGNFITPRRVKDAIYNKNLNKDESSR